MPCGFREEDFLNIVSHYKPIADTDAPGAGPIWTPESLLAGIIKGLHIKLKKNSGPHEDFFLFRPTISLWELMAPGARPIWTPAI